LGDGSYLSDPNDMEETEGGHAMVKCARSGIALLVHDFKGSDAMELQGRMWRLRKGSLFLNGRSMRRIAIYHD